MSHLIPNSSDNLVLNQNNGAVHVSINQRLHLPLSRQPMDASVAMLVSLFVTSGQLLAQIPGTIITFDVPGAGTASQQGTFPARINSYGDVVGNYKDAVGTARAFIRYASGEIITFEAPGALKGLNGGTVALGINDAGTVVGYFTTDKLIHRGFIRTPVGTLTPFDAPGVQVPFGGTVVTNVNSAGVIIGEVSQTTKITTCFLRDPDGSFVIFDGPGKNYTGGRALNSYSAVAGDFYSMAGAPGFIRTPSGTTDTFTIGSSNNVEPESINDFGEVVGSFITSVLGRSLGFLRKADGRVIPLQLPSQETGEVLNSSANSINNTGLITGYYATSAASGGFLRMPNGTFSLFQIPGGSNTYPEVINENNVITGSYCPNPCRGASRGFIIIP
jgi:hypothetical protein